MATTSTIDLPSPNPIDATPRHDSRARLHIIWIAALAVWFLNDFELPVQGKHLLALGFGIAVIASAAVALAVLR